MHVQFFEMKKKKNAYGCIIELAAKSRKDPYWIISRKEINYVNTFREINYVNWYQYLRNRQVQ